MNGIGAQTFLVVLLLLLVLVLAVVIAAAREVDSERRGSPGEYRDVEPRPSRLRETEIDDPELFR